MDFTSIDELERTLNLTDQLTSTTLIAGDFNLGDINWQSKSVDTWASLTPKML